MVSTRALTAWNAGAVDIGRCPRYTVGRSRRWSRRIRNGRDWRTDRRKRRSSWRARWNSWYRTCRCCRLHWLRMLRRNRRSWSGSTPGAGRRCRTKVHRWSTCTIPVSRFLPACPVAEAAVEGVGVGRYAGGGAAELPRDTSAIARTAMGRVGGEIDASAVAKCFGVASRSRLPARRRRRRWTPRRDREGFRGSITTSAPARFAAVGPARRAKNRDSARAVWPVNERQDRRRWAIARVASRVTMRPPTRATRRAPAFRRRPRLPGEAQHRPR